MDKECIPLCDFFNSIGLTTEFSCCGHNASDFIVLFNSSVTEEKIMNFLETVSAGRDYTPIIGEFNCWARKFDAKIQKTWLFRIPYWKDVRNPIIRSKLALQQMKLEYEKGQKNEHS